VKAKRLPTTPEVFVTDTHKIPLFPLGLVLLPDMLLPIEPSATARTSSSGR
jgi:hypothetical protein